MKSILFLVIVLFITIVYSQGNGWPGNPCEKVGATCDPIVADFCSGDYDTNVELPCGPKGIVGVGCCWHASPPQ
jgi:hypothetical protein